MFRLVPTGDLVRGAAKRRPPYFRTKKLALIGSTASSADAPWHDPTWTIASHCGSRKLCRRDPDWWFDLHRPECFRRNDKPYWPGYYDWLKSLQTPIFMQQAWPDVPASVEYPLFRILAEFRGYFTNHVSFMIALALTEGIEKIGVFGCEYAQGSEYAKQRDSLTYWLGRAEERGVELVLPMRNSTLLRNPNLLYGYESHDEQGKLVEDFRVPPVVTTTGTKTKNPEQRQLKLVDPHTTDGRIPLATPPQGEAIAWERSGLRLRA